MKKSYSQPLRSTGRPQSRRVGIERLESRSLLAGDLFHNFVTPEDADGSGSIDPLDALVVVNQLNQSLNWTTGATSTDGLTRFVDVDADDVLTPLDALVVINHINLVPSDRIHGLRVSDVDVDRRVGKIEWAIANHVLPPNITMDDADCVLATLRSGGRPELGDRVLDGQLQWKQDVFPGVGDPTKDRGVDWETLGPPPSNTAVRHPVVEWSDLLEKLQPLMGRLSIKREVLATISREVRDAASNGKPMDSEQIIDRLSALGVPVRGIQFTV